MVTPRRSTVLALVCVLGMAAPALAQDNQTAPLAQARAALEAVQYDRAQELLAEALRQGGQPRAAVLEIYTLAASTAVVLGQLEVAEQFYRRLLALDPSATLDENLAPKFKQPFSAAAAYVNAHGAVRARARRLTDGAIELVVESDPLKMVSAVRLPSAAAATALDADRRALLRGAGDLVLLLDEHGNELVQQAAPPALPIARAGTSAPSVLRRWWVWAIPSGVALATGLGFAASASAADDELTKGIINNSLTFSEAQELDERRERHATYANVSFATAGVFAVISGAVWLTRPKDKPTSAALVPLAPAPGAVGLGLTGTWR